MAAVGPNGQWNPQAPAKRVTPTGLASDARDLTTRELVAALARRNLRGTEGTIRADAARHLLGPRMPGYDGVGRGHRTRWSSMAVRRAFYVARLRAHGVDGRVIPLLAFVRDGWGWPYVRDVVATAARRSALLDRAHMNQPGRVRSMDDLIDNAEQAGWSGDPQMAEAGLDFRKALASALWYGKPAPGTSMTPAVLALLKPLGAAGFLEASEVEGTRSALEALAARRAAVGLSAEELVPWLVSRSDDEVEAGRQALRALLHAARTIQVRVQRFKGSAIGRSTNPMTLCGDPDVRLWLRSQPGRPTPASTLALAIAQGIFMGHVMHHGPATPSSVGGT
jgi:hypothetical protein